MEFCCFCHIYVDWRLNRTVLVKRGRWVRKMFPNCVFEAPQVWVEFISLKPVEIFGWLQRLWKIAVIRVYRVHKVKREQKPNGQRSTDQQFLWLKHMGLHSPVSMKMPATYASVTRRNINLLGRVQFTGQCRGFSYPCLDRCWRDSGGHRDPSRIVVLGRKICIYCI
jgi:hypothetical protein